MTQTLKTTIPFGGFYESVWGALIEDSITHYTENAETLTEHEADELSGLAYDCIDFAALRLEISRAYVVAFNDFFKDETGQELGLAFEKLTSPREYNFTTDRIHCTTPLKNIVKIYRAVDKATLTRVIKNSFTSREGFSSFYSDDVNMWLIGKARDEEGTLSGVKYWDHNQLETLIIAALEGAGVASGESYSCTFESPIYSALQDERDNGCFEAFDTLDSKAPVKKLKRINELVGKEREG